MRQITKRAFQAFKTNYDFHLDNTTVRTTLTETLLLLHGNCIARKCRKSGIVEITTAGWDTPTTKERLKPFAWVCILLSTNFTWKDCPGRATGQ